MKNKTFYRDVARAVAGNSFDVIRPSDNVPDFSERHKARMEKLLEKISSKETYLLDIVPDEALLLMV